MSMADPNVNPDLDDDNDDDDPQAAQQVTLSRKDIRALERKGKGHDVAVSERDQLKREMVFLKAGVDTDSDAGRIFMRGYDGELEVDAVKSSASAFNLVKGSEPSTSSSSTPPASSKPNPELQPGEEDLTRERADLGNQAPADQGQSPDPREEAVEIGQAVIKEGGKSEVGIGTAFNRLVKAAHDGDRRVIVERQG